MRCTSVERIWLSTRDALTALRCKAGDSGLCRSAMARNTAVVPRLKGMVRTAVMGAGGARLCRAVLAKSPRESIPLRVATVA
jgi:hypothetical protein